MINIGENIRKIREQEKSYTQKYMADNLGLSIKAYSNIENGVTDITFRRLNEIAQILECDVLQVINYNKNHQGFNNHFNNYNGNQGSYVLNQGIEEEKVKKIEMLYEQLLASERSKIHYLEQLLANK